MPASRRWFVWLGAMALCGLALTPALALSSDRKGEEPEVVLRLEPVKLEPLSEEIQGLEDKPDPELDSDTEVTLRELRDFWKREDFPHVEELYFMPFSVPPRKDELEFYPCLDCHEDEAINNQNERELKEEHTEIRLQHGANRFWCTTCHNLSHMDSLRSLKDARIDFNRSYLVCGQCHFQRQKDWFRGGHGKRIGTWTGERVILACVECHNPHSPAIKPHRPDPPPERHKQPPNIVSEVLDLFK